MSKVAVFTLLTLDGVMQAPGRPDEDVRGGFQHGGWGARYADAQSSEGMTGGSAILLGRRTYEDFAAFWPKQPEDNPFAAVLASSPKFVASTTLKEPLPWKNSTVLKGDVPEAVARLKAEQGKDLVVLGSGELVRTLMKHDLIDQYTFLIHPLVLGTGRRLFVEGTPMTALRLVNTKTTTTGVVIATYQPAEPPKAR